jgi:dUTP pyrophosphatase
MNIELCILDERLKEWGFPSYGSDLAAGMDLFACIDQPLDLGPQDPQC